MLRNCDFEADRSFGPQVHGCKNDFDFTLLFEQSILGLVPSVIFLVALLWRIGQLYRQDIKITKERARTFRNSKHLVACLLVCAQLTLLVLWCILPESHRTQVTIAAAVLSFLDYIVIFWLSAFEHTRSIRPSVTIGLYLFFSILLDIPQARTLWLRDHSGNTTITFFIVIALKVLMLLLESQNKGSILLEPYKLFPPEVLGGIWSRIALWWINPLFLRGSRNTLSTKSLYPVDEELSAKVLARKFQLSWEKSEFDLTFVIPSS